MGPYWVLNFPNFKDQTTRVRKVRIPLIDASWGSFAKWFDVFMVVLYLLRFIFSNLIILLWGQSGHESIEQRRENRESFWMNHGGSEENRMGSKRVLLNNLVKKCLEALKFQEAWGFENGYFLKMGIANRPDPGSAQKSGWNRRLFAKKKKQNVSARDGNPSLFVNFCYVSSPFLKKM